MSFSRDTHPEMIRVNRPDFSDRFDHVTHSRIQKKTKSINTRLYGSFKTLK